MKNMPSSKTAKLSALLLLLPFALAPLAPLTPLTLAPLARAQITIDTSGTTVIDSGSDAVYDSGSATSNRFTIATAGVAAGFALADSSSLTFTNNVFTGTGAAISISDGASLTLTSGANSRYFFSNNKVTGDGGAISVGVGSSLFLDGGDAGFLFSGNTSSARGGVITTMSGTITLISGTFFNNVATGNGGALAVTSAGSRLNVTNVVFASNTGNQGGAILINTAAVALVQSSTFRNNNATAAGGAVTIFSPATGVSSTMTMNDVAFIGNRATQAGGAIQLQTAASTLTGSNFLFQSNTATTNGGAINIATTGNVVNITDASFLGNVATGNGGAINVASAGITLNLTVATSATIAGNTAGAAATPNSINYAAANSSTFNVLGGAHLDMLDPMAGAAAVAVNITKTGDGIWNLGGTNSLGTAAGNTFAVNAGTLHLYSATESSGTYKATTAGAGRITLGGGSFSLDTPATLSVSANGGNTITAPTISLATGATLAFDFTGADPLNTSPFLTLNASSALTTTNWSQTLSLLNLDTLHLFNDATFNLVTLTGAGAAGSLFTADSFGGLDAIPLLAGYSFNLADSGSTLQLLYVYTALGGSRVLLWTGGDTANAIAWSGNNWLAASDAGAGATAFTKGDIINLVDTPAPADTTGSIAITTAGVSISGMYASGTQSYTLTGYGIAASATASGTDGFAATDAAASGKLILGARASDNAATLDTASPAAEFTGTLTLANGANNFEGGIEIESGVLVGNASNLGTTGTDGALVGITIAGDAGGGGGAGGGTLVFDQATSATFAAPITGEGALVKQNAGTLTLVADNSGFTGTTNVNAGALLLDAGASFATPAPAAALGGSVRVAANATFGGSGAAGSVTLASGGTLQVGLKTQDTGLSGQALTLTSDLALADGAILDYTSIYNTLLVGGAASFDGAGIFNLGTINTGTFALISAAGGITAPDTGLFTINYGGEIFDPSHYTWLNDSGTLWLEITSLTLAANNVLTWTNAAGDAAWLGSGNWMVAGIGATTHFAPGDIANLAGAGLAAGATSGTLTITLADSATASAIYVSGTASYAIASAPGAADAALVTATGVGELSGAAANGKLVLGRTATDATIAATTAAFTGTLDLTGVTGTDNFSGGVEINSGALRVASADQLGATLSNVSFTGTTPGAPGAGRGTLIAAGDMRFDSASGTANRLTVATNAAAAFVLEDGVTLTFANNIAAANGGAINIAAGGNLAIKTGAGAQLVFDNNAANSTDGGAIYLTGGTLNIDATGGAFLFTSNTAQARGGALSAFNNFTVLLNSGTFSGNTSGANGGAFAATNSALANSGHVEMTDIVFVSNTGAQGGAYFNNTNIATLVKSSTFRDNAATSTTVNQGGGAIALQNTSTMTVQDVAFINNTAATLGGAVQMQNPSALTGSNALFQGNTATNGGAIGMINAGIINLTNATFVSNTATGQGGAIYLASAAATLSLGVTTTATIAGNTASGASNGIYLGAAGNTLAFNVATGASLDMLDPIAGTAASSAAITKTGSGAWNLGGENTLGTGAGNSFTISAGALHLYRAGETSYGSGPAAVSVATGNITLGSGTFALSGGATLSAGGGNTINAPVITLAANSILAFDLAGAAANSAATLLTLNAATTLNAGGWTQTIDLLNLPTLGTPDENSTYNLLSLTGAGAGALATANPDYFTLTGADDPSLWHLEIDSTHSILQLYYGTILVTNNVLTWTGAPGNNNWSATNWALTADLATSTTYTRYDIVNLADAGLAQAGATVATSTINVDIPNVAVAGLNVSGSANYTITGNAITTTATAGAGAFTGSAAATGKLILGAIATDENTLLTTDLAPATAAYTGTLTLSNTSNNFQNGIVINTGALVGNAANLGSGTTAGAGVYIGDAGSLTFNQTTSATYASQITGAGALAKTGAATLTLAADSGAFGGTTSVSSGALLLARDAALGGEIHVAPNATFGGSGTAGSVTLAPGAALQIGLATQDTGLAPQTPALTLTSNLNLSEGATLNYASNDNTLLVGGLITQSGTSIINLLGATLSTTGSYSLIDATGGLGALFDTTLFDVNYRSTLLTANTDYLLTADATTLWLTILNIPIVGNNIITWTNDTGDHAWLTSKNWLAPSLGATLAFAQGDIVNLADTASTSDPTTASTSTLNLNTTANVAGLYVSGTASYAIAGNGSIVATATAGDFAGTPAATGKLILGATAAGADPATAAAPAAAAFTGTLDLAGLAGANNFASVEINTGALRVSTTDQLGAPLSKLAFTGPATAGVPAGAGAPGAPTLIAAGDMTFDSAGSAGGAANRLTLAPGAAGAFVLEDGVTLTFSGNSYAGAGGAILMGNNSALSFATGSGAQLVFTNNAVTTSTDGGAIYVGTGANLLINATAGSFLFNANSAQRGGAICIVSGTAILINGVFDANPSANNAGAVSVSNAGARIELTDILFTGNTGNQAGALLLNTGAVALVQNSVFASNTASSGGGAINIMAASTTLTLNDVTFDSNRANGAGGAIQMMTNVGVISGSALLFTGNSANGNGGAINMSSAGNSLNFIDASFLDNHAGGTGGAINVGSSGTITLATVTSATIAGNTAGATPAPSGIYFVTAGPSAINIDASAGAHLDMLDPVTGAAAAVVAITKTGAGVWNLGGNTTLAAAGNTFAVNSGALHLYRADETSGAYSAAAAGAGNITLAAGSFNLAATATLSAGGGNTITAATINLAGASTLALDLFNLAPGNSPILTLNATSALNPGNWTQNIDLLNLSSLTLTAGDTFNLVSLSGAGAFGANTDGLTLLGNLDPALYHLQLATGNNSLLQLYYGAITYGNNVLTWTGALGSASNNWSARNWALTSDLATSATFTRYDIVNLADAGPAQSGAPAAAATTLNVDNAAGVLAAGMNASGTTSYTITGNAITTTVAGDFTGSAAATGKLILGAIATGENTLLTSDLAPATAAYTGTLTLANTANTFQNGIDIHSGALVGNAATLRTGTAAGVGIYIGSAGTLIFDQAISATYAAPITGAGSMVAGASSPQIALTLAADNSSFTGVTTVNSGALLLANNAALGGTTSVSSAATFGGSGTAGSVTLAPNATLQIGLTPSTPDTLTLTSNLNLSDGSLLNYTNINNTLLIGGAFVQSGSGTFSFNTMALGSYSILTAAGGYTGLDTASLAIDYRGTLLDPLTDYTLAADTLTGALWLDILNIPIVGNNILTWNGAAGDNHWLTSANWTTQGVTKAFVQGDVINLASAAAAASSTSTLNLNLTTTATVAALYVSGTASYAIAGPGSIIADPNAGELAGSAAATGKLILGAIAADDAATPPAPATFTGTLDFTGLATDATGAPNENANNFANGVEIDSGVLRISSVAQLGAPLSRLTLTGAPDAPAVLQIARDSTLTFDGGGDSANRLVIPANASASFVVEDGATLTFANNTTPSNAPTAVTGTVGGALVVADGARFTIAAGAGALVAFTNNNTNVDGGAISLANGATLTLTGTGGATGATGATGSTGSFLFDSNYAPNRGSSIFATANSTINIDHATFTNNRTGATTSSNGAISLLNSSAVNLSNVIFANNTVGNVGGAIHGNTAPRVFAQSSTFTANSAVAGGGAIALQNAGNAGSATLTLLDVTFTQNTTPANGGAIMLPSANSSIDITRALFDSNTAGASGGALYVGTNNPATLTDATFTNNTAGSTGGAISMGSGALTINVTDGATSLFAGNTGNASATPAANSIYFTADAATATMNVGAGANLDMLDPLASASNIGITVSKTGNGVWNLGGNNTLGISASPSAFNVTAGALHLYRAGETSGAYTAATGNLDLASAFNLYTGATLSAGGGNTITAYHTILNSNSNLVLDLAATTAGAPAILTLNATFFDTFNWSQTLALLNLADLDSSNNDTYNLLTLGGDGATGASLFTNASFSNLTAATGLLTGYTLQVADSGATLQLLYYNPNFTNSVLTWTNAAGNNTWRGLNWLAIATGTAATYAKGDIVNLSNVPGGTTSVSSNTINIATAAGSTVAGMYVSGTENYTITGYSLSTSATIGTLAGSAAATGKLILGATARGDASAVDPAAFTGTLTLANTAGGAGAPNNFENGIDIRAGALIGSADALRAGTTADTGVTIAAASSLTFDQAANANAVYDSSISGAGALAKTGAGALTLTANSSAFGGTTSVSSGALLLAPAAPVGASQATPSDAALGGSVDVASGARFGGSGTAGSVTLAPNATLQIGLRTLDSGLGTPTSGTLTLTSNLNLSSLNLAAGAALDYAAITNQLLLTGNATAAGSLDINIGTIASGSFSLINATGGLSGFDTSLLDVTYRGSLLDADTYTFATTANQLWLTFTTLPNSVITWANSTGDNLWLSSSNWKVNGSSITKNFHQGDIVDLSGAPSTSPSTSTLNLNSSATAAAIYVSGNASYAITGPGGLTTATTTGILTDTPAATGKLILGKTAADSDTVTTAPFTGVLDLTGITGSNNFTNGIEINSGALRVANNDQLGTTLSKLTLHSTVLGSGTSSTSTESNDAVDGITGIVVTTITTVTDTFARIIVSAAGDLNFDGHSTAANHLDVSGSTLAAFALDSGVTLTIANNTTTGTNTGAAIKIGNRSTFVINGGEGSQAVFSGNIATGTDGGAIFVGGNSALVLGGTDNAASFLFTGNSANRAGAIYGNTATIDIHNATFDSNHATANGGAIGTFQKTTLTLTNVLFTANTGAIGAAIFNNTNSTTLVQSATFANNISTSNGGAIGITGSSKVTITDALFIGNSATTSGGALFAQVNGSGYTVTNALFTANSANNGGAIALTALNSAILTDVSLVANTARAAGGAFYLSGANATLDFEVSAGNTSLIAGNTAGATPVSNALNMTAVTGLDFVAGIADGATLDMLDPITAADAFNARVTKNGAGLWNLGGANQLGAGAGAYITFAVDAGTLHLYREGETIDAPDGAGGTTYTAATGNITMTGLSNFTLSGSTTLSAGGGNRISAPAIVLDPAATFALDLLNAAPNTPSSTVLTLDTGITLATGGWTQNLDLLDIDTLTPSLDGTVYNLITLTGSGVADHYYPFIAGGTFNNAGTFSLATALPENYSLQITPDGKTLQLFYTAPVLANTVLTWDGAAGANSWLGANWADAGSANATFSRGDIINLAAAPAGGAGAVSLNVDTLTSATIAGMYVSGTGNTTILGNPIVASAAAGLLSGETAATGKLVLGAKAADDASAVNASAFTGTLTLSNSYNNFQGGIEINTGALVGNDKTLGVGAGAGIEIGAAGTLTFAQQTTGTYAAPITGNGALAKTGAAALTLTDDSSGFGGTTSVSSGALLLVGDTAALGGTIHVDNGATFGGHGTAGSVALDTNATLQIGNSPGTISLASLALADGAILNFTTLGNQLLLADPRAITAAGLTTINIAAYDATATYDLGNIALLDTPATQVTIAGATQYTDARSRATLSTAGDDLILTAFRDASRVLTWTGAASAGAWALTGADWETHDGSATTVFGAGDQVLFNDTGAANPNITIAPTGALVSDMIVSGTTNYTITGGAITATATSAYGDELAAAATGKLIIGADPLLPSSFLLLPFSGTLTLSTTAANNFTGGIDLNAGALALGGTTSVSSVTRVAADATLQMLNNGVLNSGSLQLLATSTLTGRGTVRYDRLALAGGGMVTANIAASDTLVLSSTTLGASSGSGDTGILKTGQGVLQFNGAGAFGNSSVTQADEGLIRVTGFATATATTITGGIIPLVSGSYLVLNSATIPVSVGQNILVPTGTNIIPVSGLATIAIPGASHPGNGGQIVIPGCTVTIGGEETTIASATIALPYSTFTVPTVTATICGPLAIVPNASFTIPNYYMAAATVAQNVVLNGGTFAFGTTGAAAGAVNGGNDNVASNWIGMRFIQGDNAASSVITGVNDIAYIDFSGTFAPQLTGGLHVAINPGDGGVVVLGNNNTFTGMVIARSGTLQVTAATQIGSVKTATNAQITLDGGVVQFSAPADATAASYTFAGDVAVRAAANIVSVDDGVDVQFGRIYRATALTPDGAAFVKTGDGTFTLTGTNQATALVVDGGRFIVTSTMLAGLPVTNSPDNGPVTVNTGAVLQVTMPASSTVSLSGTINNAFHGDGTLEINTPNPDYPTNIILTNGKTDIANVNITNGYTTLQASSFSPQGTLTIDQGTLVLAATVPQTLGNVVLRNGSEMRFGYDFIVTTATTVTGTGAWVTKPVKKATLASLTAEGDDIPNLWFNANISQGYADHLTINAPVTGTFAVNVIPVPGIDNTTGLDTTPLPPKAAVNLELINAPASTSGTFTIGTPSIDIGLYKYTITGATATVGGNDIYSVAITGNGDMSRTAAAIYTAAAMLPLSWFSELDSVTQRLGDLHLDNRETTKAGFSAWMRGYGDKLNFNRNLTGAIFNETHYGAEAGVDYKFAGAGNWNAYLGAFMGYGQLQRNYDSATDATGKSDYDGAYLTLVSPKTGWYADALVKFNRFDNQYTVTDPSSALPAAATYYNWALGASLEVGKRQPITYQGSEVWAITPSVQLAYTKTSNQNYALTNGALVNLASGAATRARVGFTFGRDLDTPNDGVLSIYLKAYYGRQWISGADVTIALPDGTPPGRFPAKTNGAQLTGGAGLAWRFTKATQVYFDYELSKTDYYFQPYGLNLGLRHLW